MAPTLMEGVVDAANLRRALKRVRSNKGSPGVDGMTTKELSAYLKQAWPRLKEALLAGTYRPQPVKRVEIPKPGGGVRALGIPTVVDRFIQQAILQVLTPVYEPTFSRSSCGGWRTTGRACGGRQARRPSPEHCRTLNSSSSGSTASMIGIRRWRLGEPPGADPHAGWCGGRGRQRFRLPDSRPLAAAARLVHPTTTRSGLRSIRASAAARRIGWCAPSARRRTGRRPRARRPA